MPTQMTPHEQAGFVLLVRRPHSSRARGFASREREREPDPSNYPPPSHDFGAKQAFVQSLVASRSPLEFAILACNTPIGNLVRHIGHTFLLCIRNAHAAKRAVEANRGRITLPIASDHAKTLPNVGALFSLLPLQCRSEATSACCVLAFFSRRALSAEELWR